MTDNELNFVEVDAQVIINQLINDFEQYTGYVLSPGDQRRQFLQGFGYVLASLRNDINATGRNNLLRYARGENLDALGELLGVMRLPAQPAETILKFTLSSALSMDVVIPSETRATPDGTLFFATSAEAVIPSGSEYASMRAVATEAGTAHNGFVAGQISKLVDGVAYVASVTNTTPSSGGADIEGDDDFRARIQAAPFGYSTAGASEAYKYLAMSASADVGDVSVTSPSAGSVLISVVKKGGVLPLASDAVITAISAACSDKTKRPLTDSLTVSPAVAVSSTINIEYWIAQENIGQTTAIQTAVTAAVETYKRWQTEAIGRDINPDRLRKLVLNAGAEKVTVTAPAAAVVGATEVAQFTAVAVTYKGLTE